MSEYAPDDFAQQMSDGHLFLADEMVLKHGLDHHGWTRLSDLAGWRSPYMNPWRVIHWAEDRRILVKADFLTTTKAKDEA